MRPEIAVITNHGYAGPRMPTGGAPDTGGQIVYVNDMARAMESLGYRVTIFARGGFPNFKSDAMRGGAEPLTDHVRYVFVPGGGSQFIRKEDIAVALDEQLEWIDEFVRGEATARGCRPWEVYEFVNTHYWDAAVLGVGLVDRWRNDIAAETIGDLLEGVVPAEVLESAMANRHWDHLGDTPELHLGQMLIEGDPGVPVRQRIADGAGRWTARWGGDAEAVTAEVERSLERVAAETAPAFEPLAAAGALGRVVLAAHPEIMTELRQRLDRADHHVWTPHSLGELKDWNFRNRRQDVRRDLKFCERRSHERMICDRTPAFAATSVDITERLHTHYRVGLDRIFYFPPCIDTERYHPYDEVSRTPAYEYLSSISGVPADTLRQSRIVFETGRMDQTKRKDLLLAAFARIAPVHEEAYLFIGGGPDNDLFRSLQRQLDRTEPLHGRAWLTGPIPDEFMGPLFALADVYATPSEMEGFGMTVSQAAAAGTLVISSDVIPFSVHHVPDIVVLFPTGDTAALAEALDRALGNEVERRERAESLSAKVRRLNWVEKTGDLIGFLRGLGMDIADGEDLT
jgi:glycosyltransferase involved in cell wall biosynthesis